MDFFSAECKLCALNTEPIWIEVVDPKISFGSKYLLPRNTHEGTFFTAVFHWFLTEIGTFRKLELAGKPNGTNFQESAVWIYWIVHEIRPCQRKNSPVKFLSTWNGKIRTKTQKQEIQIIRNEVFEWFLSKEEIFKFDEMFRTSPANLLAKTNAKNVFFLVLRYNQNIQWSLVSLFPSENISTLILNWSWHFFVSHKVIQISRFIQKFACLNWSVSILVANSWIGQNFAFTKLVCSFDRPFLRKQWCDPKFPSFLLLFSDCSWS